MPNKDESKYVFLVTGIDEKGDTFPITAFSNQDQAVKFAARYNDRHDQMNDLFNATVDRITLNAIQDVAESSEQAFALAKRSLQDNVELSNLYDNEWNNSEENELVEYKKSETERLEREKLEQLKDEELHDINQDKSFKIVKCTFWPDSNKLNNIVFDVFPANFSKQDADDTVRVLQEQDGPDSDLLDRDTRTELLFAVDLNDPDLDQSAIEFTYRGDFAGNDKTYALPSIEPTFGWDLSVHFYQQFAKLNAISTDNFGNDVKISVVRLQDLLLENEHFVLNNDPVFEDILVEMSDLESER